MAQTESRQNIEDLKRKFEKFKGIPSGHLDTKIMAMQYERKGKRVRDLYEEMVHFAYCQGKILRPK